MSDIRITLHTDKGDIDGTIFASKVPLTSANFLNLAKRGYYDGVTLGGGYTGAGSEDLHLTVKGRRVELEKVTGCEKATEQFKIDDSRSPAEIAAMLKSKQLDPVWKDWDEAILAH